MDNALIIDGVPAAVLLAGVIIGWVRGLFKSLMGLVAVFAALIGAVWLSGVLTEPITDMIAPKVEDAVVERFADALEKATGSGTTTLAEGERALKELFEEYHLPTGMRESLLVSLSGKLSSASSAARDRAADSFRDAISARVRSLVRSTVRSVLILVLYAVLLIVLKLLTRMLDHVFDLPVLNTANHLGGAALGLLEAALLLYVVVYAASHLGVSSVTEHADETCLLPLFLNHSPVELLTSFIQ